MIDLRVDLSDDIRGIDWLDDVCENEASPRVELPGDSVEEIGLVRAFEVVNYAERLKGQGRKSPSAKDPRAPSRAG